MGFGQPFLNYVANGSSGILETETFSSSKLKPFVDLLKKSRKTCSSIKKIKKNSEIYKKSRLMVDMWWC